MAKVWKRPDIQQPEGDLIADSFPFDMSEHPIPGVQWLSDDEARARFDQCAQEALGISGNEFLRRWDAGDYDHLIDDPDHPEILRLAMMESFGR